jgi:hypothetical protein
MLDRRCFVAGATGIALAGIIDRARAARLPANQLPDVLGRPRSPAADLSHHPIAPERVVVLRGDGGDCRPTRKRNQMLRAALRKPFQVHDIGGRALGASQAPDDKLDCIFQVVEAMADYCESPHLYAGWSTGLARREALGSTGIGRGFALVHQFQDDAAVRLTNE